MELKVYAIRDRQLNAFMAPFYMHTHGSAIRAFRDNLNDPQSSASKHPEDYDLYCLGTFTDNTGTFHHDAIHPEQIAIGSNLVEKGPGIHLTEMIHTGPDNQGRN